MKEMTSKERLFAAIRFEGPDRVPLAPGLQQLALRKHGRFNIQTILKVAEEYGADPLIGTGMPLNVFYPVAAPDTFPYEHLKNVKVEVKAEDKGDEIYYYRKFQTPAGTLDDIIIKPTGKQYGFNPMLCLKEGMVKSHDDLEKIRYLLIPPQKAFDKSRIKTKQQEIGNRGLEYFMIRGALDCRAGYCRKIADMMLDYYDNYEFFKEHLMIHHQHSLEMIRAALDAGVELLVASWYFTSISAGWSPDIIKKEFMPLIKEQAEIVHKAGALFMIYDDGAVMGILDMLKDTGIDILETCAPEPGGDFIPEKARDIAGKKYAFKGGLDQNEVIYRKTPPEIEKHVENAMRAAVPEGGFILSTGDPILRETSDENVRAVFEAGKKYGTIRENAIC